MYARSKITVTRAKHMKKEGEKNKILAHCALKKTLCLMFENDVLKTPLDLMMAKNSKCVNMPAILTNTCETTQTQKAFTSIKVAW